MPVRAMRCFGDNRSASSPSAQCLHEPLEFFSSWSFRGLHVDEFLDDYVAAFCRVLTQQFQLCWYRETFVFLLTTRDSCVRNTRIMCIPFQKAVHGNDFPEKFKPR